MIIDYKLLRDRNGGLILYGTSGIAAAWVCIAGPEGRTSAETRVIKMIEERQKHLVTCVGTCGVTWKEYEETLVRSGSGAGL